MTNYVTFAHSGFYLTLVGFSVRASLSAKGVYYMGQGKEALVPSNPPVSKKQPTAVLSVSPRIVSRSSSVGSN